MPTRQDYRNVAEQLKRRLGRKPFVTLTRRDVTDLLRAVSGEPNTRLKVLGSHAIMSELGDMGLTFYPDLYSADGGHNLRLFPMDSFLAELVTLITAPGEETDKRLAFALKQVPSDLAANNTLADVGA